MNKYDCIERLQISELDAVIFSFMIISYLNKNSKLVYFKLNNIWKRNHVIAM